MTSAVGSEIQINADKHSLQGKIVLEVLVGRWFENKPVLPTVVEGVFGLAKGLHLVADEQWDERVQLSRKEKVGVLELLRLVRDDQYLVSVTFLSREGGGLLSIKRHCIFAGTWPEDSFLHP